MRCIRKTAILGLLMAPGIAIAQAKTGFQAQVRVEHPTRLDWRFVASGFGEKQAELPDGYRSQEQRFQLYVPPTYNKSKAWPLVLFVSPGDAPLGWRYWRKPCTDKRMLFCAAYGAGNRTPAGKRVRIVLDALDHVRRNYNVDPERTYVTGFSGGGRIACTIGFSLPEYFGGVIPVCGTNPLNRLDYLRHRARDRLTVAFVTGEKDFNRLENEQLMHPMLEEIGFRTKLWVVKGMGHTVPNATVLTEVLGRLEEDLPKRHTVIKVRPHLMHAPDDELAPSKQARHLLNAAKLELAEKKRTWRGVTMLQGVLARWEKTDPGDEARTLLQKILKDREMLQLVEEQGGKDERSFLAAQAKAFERFGQLPVARRTWSVLADRHPKTAEGQQAKIKVQQLSKKLDATPYLGARFAGSSPRIAEVVADGPADKGDVRPQDRITKMGERKIGSLRDVREALKGKMPGDVLQVEVERAGKRLQLQVTLGKLPS